jgi:hypothetical protein
MSAHALGSVTVQADWIQSSAPLVEVRDQGLRLVDRIAASTPLSLHPGLYVASAVLPSGARVSEPFAVMAGEPATVALEQGAEPVAFSEQELIQADSSSAMFDAKQWWVRLVDAKHGTDVTERISTTSHGEGLGDADLELSTEPGPGTLLAQVATPGRTVWNVVLPLDPHEQRRDCDLRVWFDAEGAIRCSAALRGDPEVQLLASYLVADRLPEAARVGSDADRLLEGKMRDPVGAALGGYALLRLGRLADRGGWVENLMNWFEWMPDGAILAGALATAAGDRHRARKCFRTAAERGLPIFSDGLSLVVSHLRARRAEPEPGTPEARLLALAPLASFGELTTSFPGSDPQRPHETLEAWQGPEPGVPWKEF